MTGLAVAKKKFITSESTLEPRCRCLFNILHHSSSPSGPWPSVLQRLTFKASRVSLDAEHNGCWEYDEKFVCSRVNDADQFLGPIMGILALFFTAGAVLLMFLTLLGGATNHTPLDNIYFLQVNTSNIPGAPASSRWTFWQLCAVRDGRSKCGSSHPNFPFAPPDSRNFDTDVNIPEEFIKYDDFFICTTMNSANQVE